MVVVTANDADQVVVQSSINPDFGFIRVEESVSIFENGWYQNRTLSALVKGKFADLQKLNWKKGQSIPGKLVIRETFDPINPSNLQQGLKINPQTKQVLTSGGRNIYRDVMYTQDMTQEHVLIQHDKVPVSVPSKIEPVEAEPEF